MSDVKYYKDQRLLADEYYSIDERDAILWKRKYSPAFHIGSCLFFLLLHFISFYNQWPIDISKLFLAVFITCLFAHPLDVKLDIMFSQEEIRKPRKWNELIPDFDKDGNRNIKLNPDRRTTLLKCIPVLNDEDKENVKYYVNNILRREIDGSPLYNEFQEHYEHNMATKYINELKTKRLNINKEEKRKKAFIEWKTNKILQKAVEEGKTAWIPDDEMILKDYKPKYT